MKLGIGSYTYTWAVGVPGYEAPARPLDAAGLVRLAADLGVAVVQICDNLPLDGLSTAELAELANLARELGITLELGTRSSTPGNLRRHIAIAQALGCTLLRTLLLEDGREIGISRGYDLLAQVLPDLRSAGVTLAIENHDGHRVAELAELIARLDTPDVGICLDTVNSFGALEAPDTVIGALAPLTVNLHVKDFVIERLDHKMGFQIRGCPAGQGRLEVPALLRRLRSLGRDPNVILELWTPWQGALAHTMALENVWAQESLTFLKQAVLEVP